MQLAGTLALLFGLPLSQISSLRAEQITPTGTVLSIAIRQHHLRLPPKVADLVTAQLNAPRRWQILGRHSTPSRWLFPRQSPTRPVSASKMHAGLREHGITVLAGRNNARTALAANLPAAVLADLTGIHISTAVAWSRQVKREWTALVAARSTANEEPVTLFELNSGSAGSRLGRD